MTTKEPEALHFEAFPKAVKRALRSGDFGIVVVECRPSQNQQGEHGKTTLLYTHKLDAGAHRLSLDALTKQANIEQEHLLRDDEEEA